MSHAMLVEEEFIAVQPSLVRALGGKVLDAMMVQYLHFWIRVSSNEFEDYRWVYNTYQDWSDKLGVSVQQAQRCMDRLEKMGLIVSCKPRASQWNQKKWYRLDMEHEFWDFATDSDQTTTPTHLSKSIDRSIDSDISDPSKSIDPPIQREPESSFREHGRQTFSSEPSLSLPEEQSCLGTTETQPPPLSPQISTIEDTSPGDNGQSPKAEPRSTGRQPPSRFGVKASKKDRENPDPEIIALCELMADLLYDNGAKRPNPLQLSWLASARLLHERDGRDGEPIPLAEIESTIRWAMKDDFWSGAVDSMEGFRRNYYKIRQARTRDSGGDDFHEMLQRARKAS